ncbi:cupin domain-containing protein [Ferruginibacter albus]|uniref:cupin domain-containing protein n=1 Tax=Ferruginibacter albus TaxID=2875540 RepID=UPI001CC4D794|nr:cupin domain-containing protein [Ferruginibacter albus]UAY50868.1 cupin domain-containing protein [Ferruginibacter albus]
MKYFFLLLLQSIALIVSAQPDTIPSGVFHWNELRVKKEKDRETRFIAKGITNEFSYFELHATTQQKGATPKPSHAQTDIEELIIVKEGMMKASVGDTTVVLGAGSVLLIPPKVMQALENIGDGPLTYYVLQFRAKKGLDLERNKMAGGALLLNADSLPFIKTEKGSTKKYFNRATATCENYEMHITQLEHKGPSHAAHQHVDTEIILVIDGDVGVTVDGKDYAGTNGDLFLIESGKLHGVSNISDKPCSYFAFKWR